MIISFFSGEGVEQLFDSYTVMILSSVYELYQFRQTRQFGKTC